MAGRPGKRSTVLWFDPEENEKRIAIGATHGQCWLRGLREYEKDEAKAEEPTNTPEA